MLKLRALLMYVVLSVIVTYPLVFHLHEFVTNPIDPLLYVWNLHHNFLALVSPGHSLLDTNMFYPTTNTIAYSDHLFGESIVLFPLFFIIRNPLVIQNIYILSTFVLAAFGMYLLSLYVTKSFWPSFISGVLYSFSLYHIDHAGQVPTTSIQWIPFVFLFFVRSITTHSWKDMVLFWLFFTLNFLSTLYYGLFVAVALCIFALFHIQSRKFFVPLFIIGIPFFLVLAASSYPYIVFRLENPNVVRSVDESVARSARLVDYIIPNTTHDRAVFPGFITLIFSAFALFYRGNKRTAWTFLSVGLIALIFSLGPLYKTIPLPYYLLYKFISVFQAIRVPARFGVISLACFSVLGSMGLKNLFDMVKRTQTKNFVLAGIMVVVVAQLSQIHIPFTKVPPLLEAPPVYTWLKDQGNIVLLELPLRHGYHSNPIEKQAGLTYDTISEYDNYIAETFRLYFSTIHQKNMVNGYSSYFPASYSEIALGLETFPTPYSFELFKKYRVTHLVIHKKQYGNRIGEVEKQITSFSQLEKVKEFETETVYRVTGS